MGHTEQSLVPENSEDRRGKKSLIFQCEFCPPGLLLKSSCKRNGSLAFFCILLSYYLQRGPSRRLSLCCSEISLATSKSSLGAFSISQPPGPGPPLSTFSAPPVSAGLFRPSFLLSWCPDSGSSGTRCGEACLVKVTVADC